MLTGFFLWDFTGKKITSRDFVVWNEIWPINNFLHLYFPWSLPKISTLTFVFIPPRLKAVSFYIKPDTVFLDINISYVLETSIIEEFFNIIIFRCIWLSVSDIFDNVHCSVQIRRDNLHSIWLEATYIWYVYYSLRLLYSNFSLLKHNRNTISKNKNAAVIHWLALHNLVKRKLLLLYSYCLLISSAVHTGHFVFFRSSSLTVSFAGNFPL